MGQSCMRPDEHIELFPKDSLLIKNQNMQNNQLQFRDRFFVLNFRNQDQNQDKKSESLELWMNQLVSKTISVAFNFLQEQKMPYLRAKLFVSKNIIRNLARISMNNKINSDNIKNLNNFMSRKLLPFLKNKYPLSSTIQVNKKFAKTLKQIDNLQLNQNDYIIKSQVTFDIRQNGKYEDSIMRFINQLIELPDKQTQIRPLSSKLSIFKKQSDNYQNIKDRKEQKSSYYQLFNIFFTNIFQSVYNYQIMNQESLQKQQNQFLQNKQNSYKEQVQSYTSFSIGRKISANTQKFKQQDIQNLKLDIKSPAIIRILTKWAQQLWKKFQQENYFLDYGQRFYYVDKTQGYALAIQRRKILHKIILEEKKKIQEETLIILQKNYKLQSFILNECKNRKIGFITDLQFKQGYFATINFKSLQAFLVKYLNLLIHGLTRAAQRFKIANPSIANRYLLTTFKIGDLIRCKCKSKEKQIMHIYKTLFKINDENPEILKIIRLKNRLSSNTRDILINIRFYDQLTAEIQLAIDSKPDKFMQNCTSFNHFIYELQRAKFGPISQLSSLWMDMNQHSEKFQKYIRQSKLNYPLAVDHIKNCKNHQLKVQFDPFICTLCHGFETYNTNLIDNKKCSKCDYAECAVCRMNNLPQSELKDQIFQDPKMKVSARRYICDINKISKQDERLVCLQENKIYLPVSGIVFSKFHQAKRLTCYKIFQDQFQKYMIVTIRKNQSPKIYLKSFSQFIRNHLIFQHSIAEDKHFQNIDLDAITKHCKLPALFKVLESKQKKVVQLQGLNLNNMQFEQLSSKWSQKYKNSIQKLDLQVNRITQMKSILQITPSISQLILDQNKIQVIDIPQSSRNLERLSLTRTFVDRLSINANIKNAQKIKYLNIGWSNLVYVPKNISLFKQLQQLSLQYNKHIQLPQEIFEIKALKIFAFNKNNVKVIPQKCYDLPNLQQLQGKQNELREISKSIKKLKKLIIIRMDGNQLMYLPQEIGSLTQLIQLSVPKNKIMTLPQSYKNLTKLKCLYLQQNKFSEFPSCICKLPCLEEVKLQKNMISSIPEQIQHLRNSLKSLNLSQNNVRNLPKQIWLLQKLEVLNLSSNKIQKISNINKINSLKKFQIDKNELTQIPYEIIKLQGLEQAYLSENKLIEIPESLRQFKKLIKLTISQDYLNQTSLKIINTMRKTFTNIDIVNVPIKTEKTLFTQTPTPSTLKL